MNSQVQIPPDIIGLNTKNLEYNVYFVENIEQIKTIWPTFISKNKKTPEAIMKIKLPNCFSGKYNTNNIKNYIPKYLKIFSCLKNENDNLYLYVAFYCRNNCNTESINLIHNNVIRYLNESQDLRHKIISKELYDHKPLQDPAVEYHHHYERSRDRYERSPDRYERSPDRRGRSRDRYERSPDRRGRSRDRYERSRDRYERSRDRYERSRDRYERSPDRRGRSRDRYERSPDRRGRSRDHYDMDDKYIKFFNFLKSL